MLTIWQLIGGPLAAGAPSHGTTGTMDNPALCIGLVLDAVVDQWRFKTGGGAEWTEARAPKFINHK